MSNPIDFPFFLGLCLFSGGVIYYFIKRYTRSDLELDDDIEMDTHKVIKKLVKNKVNNPIANSWIADQMQLRGITKRPSARNVGGGGGQGVKGGVKLPGSAGFKVKMGRKRPKTGRYAKK